MSSRRPARRLTTMMFGVLICLISVASSYGDDAVLSFCNPGRVTSCTEHLDLLGEQIAPLYEFDELDLLCGKWIDAKTCLDQVLTSCEAEKKNRTEARSTFEGIVARKRTEQGAREWIMGYQYLCYDGKTNYSFVRQCMSKSGNLSLLTDECYRTYENKTWWLNPNEPLNTHRYCKAARELFTCLETFTRQECGEPFMNWILKYHEHLWFSHLHDIDCVVDGKVSLGEITMVSMCGGTVAFCVFMTTLSCFCKPENKIKQNKIKKKKSTFVGFGEINPSFVKDNGELTAEETETQTVLTLTKSLEITKM